MQRLDETSGEAFVSPLTREELNRNRVAGKRAQQDCARYLRDMGFYPAAGYEMRKQHNDLLGTGDLAIEVTLAGWDKIWQKWDRQAVPDAQRRGLPYPVVWKKRNGIADPGKWGMLMTAEILVPMAVRLDRLEQAELEAGEAYDRGYRNGRAAAAMEALKTAAEEAV